MKITDIKTFVVGAEQDNWIFVKVNTDEGISGLGECSVEGREGTTVKAVEEVAPFYIGKDPFDSGALLYKCFRDGYWGGSAVMSGALSGIDVALWDIKGKALGLPVYKLLGGAVKDRLRVYANRWFFGGDTPDKLARLAESTVKRGFTALKWDPFGKAEQHIGNAQLREVCAFIGAVRDAVGDDVDLLIEGHGRFNSHTAVRIAEEIAPFKPMFFEEPVMPENLDALEYVHDKSPVPIAAGERLYSRYDFRDIIRRNAADYLQPDVRYCGGITELCAVGVMSQAAFLSMAPHNVHGLVGTMATLNTAVTMQCTSILEYSIEQTAAVQGLFNADITYRDGFIELPQAPGIGIDMDERQAGKMPFISHSMVEKMFD